MSHRIGRLKSCFSGCIARSTTQKYGQRPLPWSRFFHASRYGTTRVQSTEQGIATMNAVKPTTTAQNHTFFAIWQSVTQSLDSAWRDDVIQTASLHDPVQFTVLNPGLEFVWTRGRCITSVLVRRRSAYPVHTLFWKCHTWVSTFLWRILLWKGGGGGTSST